MATAAPLKPKTWKSRAVTRPIEPGLNAWCVHCLKIGRTTTEARVKFIARRRDNQVICNVYRKGVWQSVEHYHAACYEEAGEPYGPAREAA